MCGYWVESPNGSKILGNFRREVIPSPVFRADGVDVRLCELIFFHRKVGISK